FSSSRSRTFAMSKRSYFASRTPRATFSKSQKTAMLRVSWAMRHPIRRVRRVPPRSYHGVIPSQSGARPMEISADKQHVTLRIQQTYDAAGLEALIAQLTEARAALEPAVPAFPPSREEGEDAAAR